MTTRATTTSQLQEQIKDDDMMLREQLIAEYRAYRDGYNEAPNPWSTPNTREEAGYCLQFPGPLQILNTLAGGDDPSVIGPYWSHVRSWVLTALKREADRLMLD